MERSKTFCIKPWMHIATYTTGEALMCCVARRTAGNLNKDTLEDIWNSDHYKQARLDMLAGRENAACVKCYSEEKAGINSHRVVENHIWELGTPSAIQPSVGKKFIDNLISKTDSEGYLDSKPITFDFRLGNTCNLQCVMCGPKDSSKWVNFGHSIGEGKDPKQWDTSPFDWVEDQSFWDEQFLPLLSNVKHMIIAGGEPLLLKQHTRLLERCIAEGYSKNITIRYHTNGTVMPPHLFKLWEQFKHIDLCISMDSWGVKNDYIRYPGMWKDIVQNIKNLEDSADNIIPRIISTVNAYNVFYMPDFANWLLEQNFKKLCKFKSSGNGLFTIAYVHGPTHLNCKVFPEFIKEKITRKYDDWYTEMKKSRSMFISKAEDFDITSVHDLIPRGLMIDVRTAKQHRIAKASERIDDIYSIKDFMNSQDLSKHFPKLIDYTHKIDEVRGTDFGEIFPEMKKIVNEPH